MKKLLVPFVFLLINASSDLKAFIIPALRLSAILLSLILLGYAYRNMRDRKSNSKVRWKRKADLVIWSAIFSEGDNGNPLTSLVPIVPEVEKTLHDPAFRQYLLNEIRLEKARLSQRAARNLEVLYGQLSGEATISAG